MLSRAVSSTTGGAVPSSLSQAVKMKSRLKMKINFFIIPRILLSYGTFQRDLKQFLSFYSKFHRQFVKYFFTEAVNDQRDGLFSRNTSLIAIENLIFSNF